LPRSPVDSASKRSMGIQGLPGILRLLNRRKPLIIASFTAALILLGLILAPVKGAEIAEYSLAGDYRPRGITVDSTGRVWFTEQFGNRIGLLSGTTIYEWNVFTPGSEPWDVTVDNEGNVWFTEYHARRVARFRGGVLVEFELIKGSYPTGITVDNNPDYQNVWFTEYGEKGVTNGRIGRIFYNGTTGIKNWILIEYELPEASGGVKRQPYDIAVSPVNGLLWFTDQGVNKITCLNPWTYKFMEYDIKGSLTDDFELWGVAVDRNGFIWAAVDLTDGSQYDKICRLNPWTAEVTFYDIPTIAAGPREIAVDSVGNIWFTESAKNKIGRLNPIDLYITEYELPTSGSYPTGIAVQTSSSSPIWFTEWSSNKIGRLDPNIGKSYSTVTTITSATTTTFQSLGTAANPIGGLATSTLYSTSTISSTFTATSPTVTYWTATGTNSTDRFATSALTTNTETVYVLPTSTIGTTTSFIVSTSTTGTTVTATLTTYVSTTSITTTTTRTETYYTPVATESTYVTRYAVFTDIVSTTTLTEYAATIFRDKTVTAQYYTEYSTSTIRTTLTSYTTITVTTTIYTVVTSGMGAATSIAAMAGLIILRLRRRRAPR